MNQVLKVVKNDSADVIQQEIKELVMNILSLFIHLQNLKYKTGIFHLILHGILSNLILSIRNREDHSPNPPLIKGGLTSSNLAIRVGIKYFLYKGRVGLKGGLFRKGGFFALTWNFYKKDKLNIHSKLNFHISFF